ncbi:MAG: radical SAM/SPASM domain-containing protein [Thermodesulfobacteriota bacterium]
MSADLRLDSHKLLLHPRRVASWLDGEDVFPIYAEFSPSGACNHRCRFCALDYVGYRPRFLDAAVLAERLAELGRLGLRSAMYAGEGEPLLHREIAGIVGATVDAGIDAAITTNAVLLTRELARELLPRLTWLRVSLNAGTAATYAGLHRTRPEDFERVLANLAAAVEERRRSEAACTLGAQMLLLPENAEEVVGLARALAAIGADYLSVKPYSQHHFSHTREFEEVDYARFEGLRQEVAAAAPGPFRVIFREQAAAKLAPGRDRGYGSCLALPFWTYVDAGADVWACSAFLGDDRFRLGNLAETTFEGIWRGEARRRFLRDVLPALDTTACRRGCRMDEINRYLWELTHPAPHANFI